MSLLALGLGLVLVIEGLVFALAPSRLDRIVALVASLPREQRRTIGLIAVALGVVLVWLAMALAARGAAGAAGLRLFTSA